MHEFETLLRRLSEGRIGRRDFIKRATALGLAAAIPTGILAEEARAAEPRQGGTIRLGLTDPATTDTLDPATYISNHTQIGMFGGVLNNLTEVAPNGEIIPELAESFEASDDAKTLDAEDVLASIIHHRSEDAKSAAKPLQTH